MIKFKTIQAITFSLVIGIGFADTGKISKHLKVQLETQETVDLYLLLKNNTPIKATSSDNRVDKIQSVINQLKANSRFSENNIKSQLSTMTSDYKFYWVNNSLRAKVSSQEALQLISHPLIAKAYSNAKQQFKIPKQAQNQEQPFRGSIQWGLNMINVPQVWDQGIKGQGVLIAGQDTGYQWQHDAIKNQYAGYNGSTVDHNYHWHDAISNPNIECTDNLDNSASCDDHGHGTHTMGTMVGDDGLGNKIGVAPESKWIGCRNMNQGSGLPSTYTECFQFFMQPTDLDGNNPDVTKAPHIINNSWGCPAFEGCVQADALESVVNNVVEAGILVVVAAGNTGPGCNSIDTPAAIYQKALTIGSTTNNDVISGFSSQGAVTADGSNRIKPDLVAPGSDIRSASLNGGYVNFSGTSMASPHVAGVAALMISANPSMAGKPKILKQVLLRTSVEKNSQQTCSGVLGSSRPNNTYGWGRINALEAVNEIKDIIFLGNLEDF